MAKCIVDEVHTLHSIQQLALRLWQEHVGTHWRREHIECIVIWHQWLQLRDEASAEPGA
jgi:hypothetical protein